MRQKVRDGLLSFLILVLIFTFDTDRMRAREQERMRAREQANMRTVGKKVHEQE